MRGVSGELVVENEAGRMSCPYCKGCRTVLNGTRKGRQGYLCLECGKQWRQGGAIGGRSFPPDQIGFAIQMYYTGLSFRQAAKELKHRFGIHETDVSPETIRNWVDSYTDAAIRLVRWSKAPDDAMWWDFRKLTLSPPRTWMMMLDDRTGYIEAIHVADFWRSRWGFEVFDDAGRPDGVRVSEVVHLMMQSGYDWRSTVGSEVMVFSRDGTDRVGDRDIEHIEYADHFPPGITAPKIFGEYHAACARFERNDDTWEVMRRLVGWMITRNWFTKQRELGGRTPGQAAGIESPIATWADVVRLEARASLPAVGPKAAVTTRPPSNDPRERG